MNRWKNFALLAGICAIPVAAWAYQPPTSLPRVTVSVNGQAYPVTRHTKTYRTPNGVVRVETLSWHAPNGTGSVVSYTETGRTLPDAPLPSCLRSTMSTMAQMQMMQTQFTQIFSRINRVFAAAFSPPAMLPLNHPKNLMQTSAHPVTRAPLGDHGSAVLM
ncbi:MAG: hypothetical protein ACYCP0_00045 [Acidiferrobacteraceae bacterium]